MKNLTKVLTLCLAAAGLGCGTQSDGSGSGSLSLALSQELPGGEVYRLDDAVLVISGAVEARFETDSGQTSFDTALPPGSYELLLEPGYSLMRVTADGAEEVVAALASDNPQSFEISAGGSTVLGLRFLVDGGDSVEIGEGALSVDLQIEPAEGSAGGGADQPVTDPAPDATCEGELSINEVDYDQEGADEREFVEILNSAECSVDTNGLSLLFYNGGASDGVASAYAEIDLSGGVLPAGGYLVVAGSAIISELGAAAGHVDLGTVSLQNGDPDGVALVRGDAVVDALSYGGAMDGITEGESAPIDPGQGSLGRCADGEDSDDNAADFELLPTPTPGSPNCP